MVRYTLHTGEPITVGFMRLNPGKTFWGVVFSVAGFIERSMPGWALATATALAAFQLGRIPGATEQGTVIFWGYVVFLVCAFLVSIGGRIERTLEIANWIMMVVVLGGLLILDIFVVPPSTWGEALVGYVSFGQIPEGVDLLLLGALVGYSAYGGFGNNAITNWYRDKGYGMGEKVGYIPTAMGGTAIHVSPHGNAAPVNEENISRFKGWWKLLNIDQWAVFWGGAMLGMLLPLILLAVSANVANFTMALSAILTIIVNRKFLPREFRPAVWREFILVLCLLFFGFFFSLFIASQVFGLKL